MVRNRKREQAAADQSLTTSWFDKFTFFDVVFPQMHSLRVSMVRDGCA